MEKHEPLRARVGAKLRGRKPSATQVGKGRFPEKPPVNLKDGSADRDLGEVWWAIVSDRNTVTRRVETIKFETASLRERRVSLDLDLKQILGHYANRGLHPAVVSVPLLLQPKGLIFDFDLIVAGQSASLASRYEDSEISVAMLGALGTQDNCGVSPPESALDFLRELCVGFPDGHSLAAEVAEGGLERAIRNRPMTDECRNWLLQSANSQRWVTLAERLATEFFIVVSLPVKDSPPRVIVKFRRLESASDSEAPLYSRRVTPPGTGITVRIFGAGRARSEHFHVVAPPGTFFSAGRLSPVEDADFQYYDQRALDRLVFYTNNAPSGELVAAAVLYPSRRDFVNSARVLTIAIFIFLVIGAVSEFINGELERLSHAVEAVAVIALFTPSAVLAYLMKPDDHELRWRTLSRLRMLSFLALIPLVGAVGALLPDPGDWAKGVLKWIWTASAVVAGLIMSIVVFYTNRMQLAERDANAREGERTEESVTSAD